MTKFSKYYQEFLCLFLNKSFGIWERLGIHIIPNHFYQPIPEVRSLDEKIWDSPSKLIGIDIADESQILLLAQLQKNFKNEYDSFPISRTDRPHIYYINNGGFESVDGEILYSVIRQFHPRRIIEIGSGNSTYLSAQAIQRNKEEDSDYDCELIAIEPYPNEVLLNGFQNLSRLIKRPVQEVPFSIFETLNENDVLFIDSSHVLNIGGDVQYEFNEILPRLKKGVLVHIHDIFLPYEYSKKWVCQDHRFWTEQYLLQAFLTFNTTFKIIWAGHYMHRKYPELLEKAFNSYNQQKTRPGSFWIRKEL
jgi:hypothetical protein